MPPSSTARRAVSRPSGAPRRASIRPARARSRATWSSALEGVVPDRVLLSPWLRRLGRISFLGALDQAPGCRARPSRLDHVAGVARLALSTGRALRLHESDLRLLVTAALLHDVGHHPLSHTAESAFRERWGLDHHGLSRRIVTGEGMDGGEPLARALASGGIDPGECWGMIAGSHPLSPLLSGAMNLDTLDGIPRAARAFGRRVPKLPEQPFRWHDGRLALAATALPALDRFWRLKDRIYRDVINAPAHAALELRLSALVGRAIGSSPPADLIAFDDAALMRLLGLEPADLAPDEDERDASYAASLAAGSAPVRVRREHLVDASVPPGRGGLDVADWPRRWATRKHRWFLVTRSPSVQLLLPGCWELEGDLP